MKREEDTDMNGAEEWRPIVGYEGLYEVSSDGRVRRSGSGRGARVGLILRQFPWAGHDGASYWILSLWKDKRGKSHLVHRLMACAFFREPLPGEEVNHKDGNKRNNDLTNLEWVTGAENLEHARRTGLAKLPPTLRGSECTHSKLTEDTVREIRRLREEGLSSRALARRFGVSRPTVMRAAKGLTWGHVA